MRLPLLSMVMSEPEIEGGRGMGQTNGSGRKDKRASRRPCVRVGGTVGWVRLLVGCLASGGGGRVCLLLFSVVMYEPEIRVVQEVA